MNLLQEKKTNTSGYISLTLRICVYMLLTGGPIWASENNAIVLGRTHAPTTKKEGRKEKKDGWKRKEEKGKD